MFKEKQINGKAVYYSDLIDVEHFFTSRDLVVKDNIDAIKDYLGVERLIRPGQTHSDNVEIVDECIDYNNVDALILNVPNTAIYLNFADCTPVILYDEVLNISAIAHAGWRGTASKIVQKTAFKMFNELGSKPKNVSAVIGPCISFEEFETYEEAINLLKASVKNHKGLFNGRYADLKGINAEQLREIGIEKTDICPYCTVRDNDKFFSYRKENKTSQRHSAVIKIK
ncbi:peptidoglycan editing factor PgeF [bacterium]|nr:peptidoglycan editing factor PgeF [bacterium]